MHFDEDDVDYEADVAECDVCVSQRRLGMFCRRATCSIWCHRLYLLDVRALVLTLFDLYPACRPDLTIRVSAKELTLIEYRHFRRVLADELSRRKIPFVLVTSFAPFKHETGFVRGVARCDVVSAIKSAARRCGIALAPGQFAVAPIASAEAWTRYLTKAEEVDAAAPKGYRVCTASHRSFPISLSDGLRLMWAKRALHPDPRKRRGYPPSDQTLERILSRVRARQKRFRQD